MNLEKPPHDYNPYQAPEATLYEANQGEGELLDEPVSLPAGSGVDWLKHAWAIFMARPLLWVGFAICYLVGFLVLSLIPIINFFVGFLGTFILAGVAYVAYQIDMDEPVGFGDFFMGFRHNVSQQVLLIIINFAAVILLIIAFALLATVFGAGINMTTGDFQGGMSLVMVLIGLVALFFYVPLIMCMWLAPILILFHDVPAFSAMKMSFRACLKNILPFFVFGILLIPATIIAMIPLGLGLLILTPVMMIAGYSAYKQMLTNY